MQTAPLKSTAIIEYVVAGVALACHAADDTLSHSASDFLTTPQDSQAFRNVGSDTDSAGPMVIETTMQEFSHLLARSGCGQPDPIPKYDASIGFESRAISLLRGRTKNDDDDGQACPLPLVEA